jgi:hypothetical protein
MTALVFEDFTRLKSFSVKGTLKRLWMKLMMFTHKVKSFFKEVTSLVLRYFRPLYTKPNG